jgi:Amt family ammonium transporter
MESLKAASDTLFILAGAVMVLAMHGGFAFLELGTVRKKNQVNALVKILVDFSVSTVAYFFIGYAVAYGVTFFAGAESLVPHNATVGLRIDPEEEFNGANLSVHKISATSERETAW